MSGDWEREGPSQILVKRESAIHRSSDFENVYTIDRDHSNLVKFMEDDSDLDVVLHFLDPVDLMRSEAFIRPSDTCRPGDSPHFQDRMRSKVESLALAIDANYHEDFEDNAEYRNLGMLPISKACRMQRAPSDRVSSGGDATIASRRADHIPV